MKTRIRSGLASAFTFRELIFGLVVVAALVAIAIAGANQLKQQALRIKCRSNLRCMGCAFRLFATDNDDKYVMQLLTNATGVLEPQPVTRYFQLMSNELTTPYVMICPGDDRTRASGFGTLCGTNISYFIGLDAVEVRPSMLLAGDRKLTNGQSPVSGILELRSSFPAGWTRDLHSRRGNIIMGDGSVQSVNSAELQESLRNTGDATNRIVLP
jgi:prepilin-type processing-associated H-X9-DG protein